MTLLFASTWLSADTLLNETQALGPVQQWAPGAGIIKVAGVTYRISSDFQVMDRKGRKLSVQDVRPGAKVMVVSVAGRAMHVIVDPGNEAPLDVPQK
ncbi:MAG: hypothetical protein R3E94_16775 [Burkholderiaceae bacterium]